MHAELAAFRVAAKLNTHASDGSGSASASALTGARQRDYRAGRCAYRDVHFGLARFTGQETVALDDRVVWSMVYCGGVAPDVTNRRSSSWQEPARRGEAQAARSPSTTTSEAALS